jgi:hypothetical protein
MSPIHITTQQLDVAWRRARSHTAEAYAAWCAARATDRREAYAVFLAAADREAAAETAFLATRRAAPACST